MKLHLSPRRGPALRRASLWTVAGALAFAGLSGLSAAPAQAVRAGNLTMPFSETFNGATTTPGQWTLDSPAGTDVPCLTAGTLKYDANTAATASLPGCGPTTAGAPTDPAGKGAFRLTNNSKNDGGGIVLNDTFNAKKGLHFEFDQYQYNTSASRGADGISFFLIDGSVAHPGFGPTGGPLGYYCSGSACLKGALLGVGFDEYGNFSRAFDANDKKAPGGKPNSVVIRDTAANNYRYVAGNTLDAAKYPLAVDKATARDQAKRHIIVDISNDGHLTLVVGFGDNVFQIPFKDYNLPGISTLPDSVKLGFGATTGSATNYHEINNLKIDKLNPEVSVTTSPVGTFQAGGTGTSSTVVTNAAAAGDSTGATTVTIPAPAGTYITASSGNGWDCTVGSDQKSATCTRTDVLKSGGSFPPINTTFSIPAGVTGPLNIGGANVVTPGDPYNGNNTAPTTDVPVAPPAVKNANLNITTTPDGPFQAGGTGSTTTTVANDPAAGPTSGTTTVTIPAADSQTIKSSQGDGWDCKVASDGKSATCTRSDSLEPGKTWPPIHTEYNVPANSPSPAPVGGSTVTNGSDTKTAPDTTTPVLPAKPTSASKVTIAVTPNPYQEGKPLTYTITATNTGKAPLTNGDLLSSVSPTWKDVPWKCTATGGAVCPPEGKGDLKAKVTIPPGGTLTFTAACKVPAGATSMLAGSVTLTAAGDANCATGCKATATANAG